MSFYYTFTVESDSERILKIGQHLPKLWAIKYRVVFLMKHGLCLNKLCWRTTQYIPPSKQCDFR